MGSKGLDPFEPESESESGPAAKAPPVAPSGTAKWPLPTPCWRCATACGFRICPATVKLSPGKLVPQLQSSHLVLWPSGETL